MTKKYARHATPQHHDKACTQTKQANQPTRRQHFLEHPNIQHTHMLHDDSSRPMPTQLQPKSVRIAVKSPCHMSLGGIPVYQSTKYCTSRYIRVLLLFHISGTVGSRVLFAAGEKPRTVSRSSRPCFQFHWIDYRVVSLMVWLISGMIKMSSCPEIWDSRNFPD